MDCRCPKCDRNIVYPCDHDPDCRYVALSWEQIEVKERKCKNCHWYICWMGDEFKRCVSRQVRRAFGNEINVRPYFCCKYFKKREEL